MVKNFKTRMSLQYLKLPNIMKKVKCATNFRMNILDHTLHSDVLQLAHETVMNRRRRSWH